MHFPVVGELVWVGGCAHEFIVVQADYSPRVATISPVESRFQTRRCPFHLLFPHGDFEASQRAADEGSEKSETIGSSRLCVHCACLAIREMRVTISRTQPIIHKSLELIAQTDLTLARWKALGCEP